MDSHLPFTDDPLPSLFDRGSNMLTRHCFVPVILYGMFAVLSASFVHGEDWPGFRGPQRTGVSTETGLLKEWPKEGPKLHWVFKDAGMGFSSVAVVKGVVYTLGTEKDNSVVIALDLNNGEKLWSAKLGGIFNFKGNTWGQGPRSTPTLDGELLFALDGGGELVCYDVNKRAEVWRKDLVKDFGGEMMTEWGYSESPLVDGDLLICTPGGKQGAVVALNKKSGEMVWRTKDLPYRAPYTSPVLAEINKTKQYVQMSYEPGKGGFISGIDPKAGKALWTFQMFEGDSYNVATTAIVAGEQVYYSNGNGHGSGLLSPAKMPVENEYTSGKAIKAMKNNHGGVIKVGDAIYGHSENRGWVKQDFATGKELGSDKNQVAGVSGSLTAADGLLYLLSDSGEVALVKDIGKSSLDIVSSFTIPHPAKQFNANPAQSAAKVWAHPVISNGCLFIRDQENVMCFKLK
jgi:outer membrane protein assembly factor BamB